jgi:ribosomal protein S18 acetylase RimI-like enzyme
LNEPVRVRPATGEDWDALWPIWHETVAAGDTYAFEPDTPVDEARRLWMLGEPAEVWLAESGAQALGSYLLKPNQPGLGAHVANASFMVAARARGRGVGRLLAEHCLDRARALGYLAMQFNAVVATNTGAIALWRSLGFSTVGTIPGGFRHRGDGLVDLYVMHRFL